MSVRGRNGDEDGGSPGAPCHRGQSGCAPLFTGGRGTPGVQQRTNPQWCPEREVAASEAIMSFTQPGSMWRVRDGRGLPGRVCHQQSFQGDRRSDARIPPVARSGGRPRPFRARGARRVRLRESSKERPGN
ncbi:hypothetical protein NDU88_009921 [Pleurodeles waltl]|uniref:Uncharacterized protein n=1 Tax=Pleurodeles waltl TaxID=8319 RepID=A0AAV7PTG2_PLEWA|nr:hypothetical protein NDU88_009921 [Pleurodeles waltl]